MGERVFGYARVSSREQNLDRQIVALQEFGIEKRSIYCDKISGKEFERPAYRRLVKRLKRGDLLVVKSIDRLGRGYNEILEEWRRLTKEKGVDIVVLDMPLLDTRQKEQGGVTGVFMADLILQLLSYIAHIERDNIRSRQAEGISAAKARGVRFGRPPIEKPDNWQMVISSFNAGEITRKHAAELLGIGLTTFDAWRREAFDCAVVRSDTQMG